jgi:hypothetical protein
MKMRDRKETNWLLNIIVVLIIVSLPMLPKLFQEIKQVSGGHDLKKVRTKIKKALYKKYGEEFVVDRIGIRSSRDQEFYQARIYPKLIIGTSKEDDSYYYASASVDKLSFGRLGGVGDSYPLVNLKLGIEDYLMPRAKELFGKRILMKIEAHYKKREPGNTAFWGYKVESYEKARKLIAEDPENGIIELDLDFYIFNRIDDKKEKEKRRQQIFDFVQYLKDEGLFEYLEMSVIFIDERVLAPSYNKFSGKIKSSNRVRKYIEEEDVTVKLPPMELRKQMSRKLQKQVNNMSEEDLLNNMQEVDKDELGYDGIGKNNTNYFSNIYSPKILEEKYSTSLRKNPQIKRFYKKVNDVKIRRNLEYVYIN